MSGRVSNSSNQLHYCDKKSSGKCFLTILATSPKLSRAQMERRQAFQRCIDGTFNTENYRAKLFLIFALNWRECITGIGDDLPSCIKAVPSPCSFAPNSTTGFRLVEFQNRGLCNLLDSFKRLFMYLLHNKIFIRELMV